VAGFSPIESPSSPWREVRQLRPQVFDVAAAYFDDPDLVVRGAALSVAATLVQDAELAVHRERVASAAGRGHAAR
jgi:hypothetical protein